ncbi:epoxide hydrolase family protein [Streptomyces sp. NPDC056401]|uniref:epoxide hydrolase family protein n=1 Tax=Streptomyces sp. NPDC056401 TaxID=3345809 RepID=UPI0035E3A7B0
MSNEEVRPFRIEVPQKQLDELARRLDETRWPDGSPGVGWSQGIPLDYTRELAEYWRSEYDWRAQEERLNSYSQFKTLINGPDVHFIHVRSPHDGAMPLILTHGWPGSIVEFLDVIGPLTDPVAHGGSAADAFHVVVPSLPGFGFSGPRPAGWANKDTAKAWAELMRRLGYDRYTAHAGDLGHAVSHELGVIDSEHMAALHLTGLMAGSVNAQNVNLDDPTEKRDLELQQRFDQELGAYAQLQMTRPQSLSYALADSPVGQLAWIVERFRDWTAAKDVPEDVIDRDAMLNNVMFYWLTNTAGSTARWYWEMIREPGPFQPLSPVPTAFAIAPDDIFHPVRRLAENHANIVRWTELARGGHFIAMEQPDLLVADLRESFRPYR